MAVPQPVLRGLHPSGEALLFIIKILFLIVLKTHNIKFTLLTVFFFKHSSVHFSHSVSITLCDPMNRSTPGFPVHHQLPEFIQTHVRRVGDAI